MFPAIRFQKSLMYALILYLSSSVDSCQAPEDEKILFLLIDIIILKVHILVLY